MVTCPIYSWHNSRLYARTNDWICTSTQLVWESATAGKKEIRYRSQGRPLIRKNQRTTYSQYYKKNRSFGQSECEGRNIEANLCQMPSVMKKPNLYSVWVLLFFLNSEQGCDVTSFLFSLGADKSPRAIVCLFTWGPFFCFIMPKRREEAQRRREGWRRWWDAE